MKKPAPAKNVEKDIKKFVYDGRLYIKSTAGAMTGHGVWKCEINPVFVETQFVTVGEDGTVKAVGKRLNSKHEKCECLQIPGSFMHFEIKSKRLIKIVDSWGETYRYKRVGGFEYYYNLFKKSKKNHGT
jgi:hypothetical protein